MSKFKIGDKVEVVNRGETPPVPDGACGTVIAENEDDNFYKVEFELYSKEYISEDKYNIRVNLFPWYLKPIKKEKDAFILKDFLNLLRKRMGKKIDEVFYIKGVGDFRFTEDSLERLDVKGSKFFKSNYWAYIAHDMGIKPSESKEYFELINFLRGRIDVEFDEEFTVSYFGVFIGKFKFLEDGLLIYNEDIKSYEKSFYWTNLLEDWDKYTFIRKDEK